MRKYGITRIYNCNFILNTAGFHGGAIASLGGTLKISNSYFSKNSAELGGALYIKSNKVVLRNLDFGYNKASMNGNAIYSKTTKLTLSKLSLNKNHVYGVFFVKITTYKNKFGKNKIKIKITSPWGVSLKQKVKIKFTGFKSKWYKTNSKGKLTVKIPKNVKITKKSFKIEMKKGFGVLKSWKNMVTAKLNYDNNVKKPSKIKIKVINKVNGKAIKKKKFTVKVYTGSKYKSFKIKINSKGILKISSKKLSATKHKIIISLSGGKYAIDNKITVRIR